MMEAPARITPKGLADYLDVLTKAVFQSGISWRVVEAKWPGTREALHGFDPERLANLSPKQIDALAEDTRLIRNRRKIAATAENARTLLTLDSEHNGFRRYLRSFPDFDALSTDLVRRFTFLGAMGAYYFLYVVGEDVPPHDEVMARQAEKPTRRRRTPPR
jgi:3-methyladenine DNA glycosylase Tag